MGKYINGISEIILDAVDIEQLISEYVPLKRAGTNVKGLCPFHNEKTPSFVVSKEKQIYHCFGCGASGNAIGFVMAIENMDFLDAIEFLADKARLDLNQYLDQNSQRKNYKPIQKSTKEKYTEVTRHAARFFYANLKNNEKAYNYFKNRGITDQTIKTFGLGYALDEWNSLMNYLAKPPYSNEDLEKVGLIIKKDKGNGYYDRFRDRVIFPIIDVQGKVVGFGGRIIGDGQPKYLNSPETPIFNKSNTLYNLNLAKNTLTPHKTLIVVEGYMDVIALYQSGIKNVVATLGTALTEQHGRLLKRYADEIIIAYDSDEAGQKATKRSVDILEPVGLKVKVLLLSEGLDPDEYIKKYGVETFQKKIEKSLSYIDYQIQLLRQSYNLDYEEDQRRFYAECLKLIKPIKSAALKDKYATQIAKWAHISLEAVRFELRSSRTEQKVQAQSKKSVKRSKIFIIETRLLYLSLINKQSFDKIFELVGFDRFTDQRNKKIMTFLVGYYQVMDKFELDACIDHLNIDDIKYIQLVLEKSVKAFDPEKEIDANVKNFELECLNLEIIKLMNKIMRTKEADEIRDEDKKEIIKQLNLELAGMKQEQAKLIKVLGR